MRCWRTPASRSAASGLWHTTKRSARPLGVAAAGCHAHFFHAQVVSDGVVVAGAGKRGGGLGVGVAQLLGVDVVAVTTGQVGAVGGRGEPGVGHPYQPVQLPGPEVVLHRADDRLVTLVAGNVQQRTGMPSRVTAIGITT
jgi:hypothetical protein